MTLFDRIVAILAMIAAIIGAYYAYSTYVGEHEPDLKVMLFDPHRDEDEHVSELDLLIGNARRDKDKPGLIFDLPLVAVNEGNSDARDGTVWIGPQQTDEFTLELKNETCGGWLRAKKASARRAVWFVKDRGSPLSPHSQFHDECLQIRVKEGISSVTLSWSTLASKMSAKEGAIILRFTTNKPANANNGQSAAAEGK